MFAYVGRTKNPRDLKVVEVENSSKKVVIGPVPPAQPCTYAPLVKLDAAVCFICLGRSRINWDSKRKFTTP